MKRLASAKKPIRKSTLMTAASLFLAVAVMGAAVSFLTQKTPSVSTEMEPQAILFMSDTQADPATGDYKRWGELLALAVSDSSSPAYLLLGGDVVNDSKDEQEWGRFYDAGGAVLSSLHVYAACGNHDDAASLRQHFSLPNSSSSQEGLFYSTDIGAVHLTVLDSNRMGAADPQDVKWLEEDLAKSNASLRIVMFHHPTYPAADIPKDAIRASTIQETFVPIFEQNGVDLVLGGHQHVYQRTQPMLCGKPDINGITYVMGVAGGKQYTPVVYPYVEKSIGETPVYTILEPKEQSLLLKTYDKTGSLVDTASIADRP